MKIVILDAKAVNGGDLSWEEFEKYGCVEVYDSTPGDLTSKRIANADIVYTNKTVLDRNIILQAENLKFIGVLATGYNVVDINAAKEKNIVVSNIPTYGTMAVAQAAIALLLEITNRVGLHSDAVSKGAWLEPAPWCFTLAPILQLEGKTMGIIGYGRIGKATGRIAQALGLNVIAYSPSAQGDNIVSLDEIYRLSDIIMLHCPQNEKTYKMINDETIAKMKDGVIIVNNSRGGLIDESALRRGLDSNKIYAAGLDVVDSEPMKKHNPLLGAERCFITPHISWQPYECRKKLMDIAVDNLKAFLQGSPQNVVS